MSEQSPNTALQRAWFTFARRPDPLTSVAFTLPVFLAYHLGIVLVDRRSPVDFVSSLVLSLLNASVPVYVVATLALSSLLLVVAWFEQRRSKLPASSLGRVSLEGAVGALVVLIALGWTSHRLLRTSQTSAIAHYGVFDKLVLAAGTGFYEELLFRVGLLSGGAYLLRKLFELTPNLAFLWALALASLGPALLHNFGLMGQPFVLDVFAYRVLEGVVFALLYLTRGFAVAVYAHTFYEVLVYFVYA